jgi:uncharacterized membrane protein HdeD (DUF308 family)
MLESTFLITRGLVGIAVGVLAFLWPGLTIAVLVGIFALYALIDGVTNLILSATGSSKHGSWWALLFEGLVGVAAGVLTFFWPGITVLALVWLIATWAIVTGILEIAAAIKLRRVITNEWLLMLSGALSILFGVYLFGFPIAGAIGIAWVLGAYAAVTGIILVVLGIRLRSRVLVVS